MGITFRGVDDGNSSHVNSLKDSVPSNMSGKVKKAGVMVGLLAFFEIIAKNSKEYQKHKLPRNKVIEDAIKQGILSAMSGKSSMGGDILSVFNAKKKFLDNLSKACKGKDSEFAKFINGLKNEYDAFKINPEKLTTLSNDIENKRLYNQRLKSSKDCIGIFTFGIYNFVEYIAKENSTWQPGQNTLLSDENAIHNDPGQKNLLHRIKVRGGEFKKKLDKEANNEKNNAGSLKNMYQAANAVSKMNK